MSYQPTISKFFPASTQKSSRPQISSPPLNSKKRSQRIDYESSNVNEHTEEPHVNLSKLPDQTNTTNHLNHDKPTFEKPQSSSSCIVANSPNSRQSFIMDKLDGENLQRNSSTEFSNRLSAILQRESPASTSIFEESSTDGETLEPAAKRSKCSNKLTPLDQQVKDLKLSHMDKILAVRVGYKYKFFAQDAVVVSKILQIMLIKGKLTLDDSHPSDYLYKQFAYCSIPDNRLVVHLQRLLHHNLKVGVVEQTETQAIKKNSGSSSGVFQRNISKVFTRATFSINETFQSDVGATANEKNTIWAMASSSEGSYTTHWLISVQLNTGDIVYDSFSEKEGLSIEMEKRIAYLCPIEVVSENSLHPTVHEVLRRNNPDIQVYEHNAVSDDELLQSLSNNGNISSALTRVALVMRGYLKTYGTEKVMDLTNNYRPFNNKNLMLLSSNTLESLEIFQNQTDYSVKGTLFWLLDHTRTPFGCEKLKSWISQPLTNREDINLRLDAIECIRKEIKKVFMEGLSTLLRETPNFLRILNRIYYGQTSRREVFYFLKHLDKISRHFLSHHQYIDTEILSPHGSVSSNSTLLVSIFEDLNTKLRNFEIPTLLNMINVVAVMDKNKEKQCVEFFNLNNYDNSEVIISKLREIQDIKDELQKELERTRRILNRPKFTYKDEKEYLIEVRNSQVTNLPQDWVKVNCTKTVSRFRTPETAKLVEQLEYQKNLLMIVTEDEYKKFLQRITGDYDNLRQLIDDFASFDCILSLAATSMNKDYVRPTFTSEKRYIKVANGRNPVIESLDVSYVPNDIFMTDDMNKVMVITGPNMGGKSSYIRQVALTVILAQIGSYVPADNAELSVFESIFTRIGAHDNILRGESTFKVEMLEMLDIIRNCSANSLLLLDEVGRGTGTTDGVSISYAILKHFLDLEKFCPFVLFITHYPILGTIESPLLENYHMSYIEEKRPNENWPSVILLYKLKRGPTHNSYGLNVARLANIPINIINRAYQISEETKIKMESERDFHFLDEVKRIISTQNQTNLDKVSELLKLHTSL